MKRKRMNHSASLKAKVAVLHYDKGLILAVSVSADCRPEMSCSAA
jgi:hypothetical protein